MGLKIVFFILAVVKVNFVWTVAFPSHVHEMMTPEEISQTFGTNIGPVPNYQVVRMKLPRTRKYQADDEIHLQVEINATEISLTFKPTAGYLATRYTPVWLAVTDQEAYNTIRYDPQPNAMDDIGAFKMYQDVDNRAAIVVYADPDQEAIIEGIITLHYAIKSLPRRFMEQTLKVDDNHLMNSSVRPESSFDPDADEITTYCALFETTPLAEKAERDSNMYRRIEKRSRHSEEYIRSRPEAVYPEILLVLDHNAIRNRTITQALRFMLALWNGVDMIFSTLNDPKVHLNIAGIIISADDAATPYIAEDTSINIKPYSNEIIDQSAKYFAKELDRFPVTQYDMMIAMTPITLCIEEADNCEITFGSSSRFHACTSERQAKRRKKINGVAVANYNWMFGGVHQTVHESAHLFNVRHDEGRGSTAQCNYTEGYIMAMATEFNAQNSKWSSCSEKYFQDYFSSPESRCLDNKPMSIKPVKEVLPGRWLNLDGQCQNSGFEKSCKIPGGKFPVCMIKGCKRHESNECEISEWIPLLGTKCGENKYCGNGARCLNE